MTTSMWCSMSRTARPSSARSRPISSVSASVSRGFMPGGRLVEEQEPRLGGERPRDLEPPLIAVGEVLGELVVLVRRAPRRRGDPGARPRARASSATTAGGPEDGAGDRGLAGGSARPPGRCRARSCSGRAGWTGRCARCRAPTMAWGRRPTRLAPSSRISPWSGRSSPVTRLKKVVLPAPFGPMSPTMPRGGITRSTRSPPRGRRSAASGRAPSRTGAAARQVGAGRDRPRARPASPPRAGGAVRPTSAWAASACSSTSAAGGRTRRPGEPFRSQEHDDDQAQAEEEPAPEREIDGGERRDARRSGRSQRIRKVIWASRIRSKRVMSMPPRITPLRLPMPPSTTMHSSMIETLNSKAPGVMAWSLAA